MRLIGAASNREKAAFSTVLPHHGRMAVISRAVDLLPERLWATGNLFVAPWGHRIVGRWHFCVGQAGGRSVRTVERNGRTLVYGRHRFDFDAH